MLWQSSVLCYEEESLRNPWKSALKPLQCSEKRETLAMLAYRRQCPLRPDDWQKQLKLKPLHCMLFAQSISLLYSNGWNPYSAMYRYSAVRSLKLSESLAISKQSDLPLNTQNTTQSLTKQKRRSFCRTSHLSKAFCPQCIHREQWIHWSGIWIYINEYKQANSYFNVLPVKWFKVLNETSAGYFTVVSMV